MAFQAKEKHKKTEVCLREGYSQEWCELSQMKESHVCHAKEHGFEGVLLKVVGKCDVGRRGDFHDEIYLGC